jgi:hypothetical protein
MKTSQERWAVVINDDPRVYRTIQSVVNVYRFKVTAIASRAFKVSTFVEGVAIPSSVFQADVLPFILRHNPTAGEMDEFKEPWKSWMKKFLRLTFRKED